MRKCDCCKDLFKKDSKKFKSPIKNYENLCYNCLNNILLSMDMGEKDVTTNFEENNITDKR